MSHPYSGHKEAAVGHRRVKSIMRANGGAVTPVARASGGRVALKAGGGEVTAAKPVGKKAGGRLDKRARGGATKKQAGGPAGLPAQAAPRAGAAMAARPVLPAQAQGQRPFNKGGKVAKRASGGRMRKLTPSKHKPHINININSDSKPRGLALPAMDPGMAAGPVPPVGVGGPPMMQAGGTVPPRPAGPNAHANPRAIANWGAHHPAAGAAPAAGLPPQANPQAAAALAARRPLPAQAQGARPFQMGGGVGGPPYSPTMRPTGTPIPGNAPVDPNALAALYQAAQAGGGRGMGFQRGGIVPGKMRTKGSSAGQGSGAGRLEEFHHMKGSASGTGTRGR